MPSGSTHAGEGMHVVGRRLIVSVPPEPSDDALRALRRQILAKLEASPIPGVVVDVSRVRVLDSTLFGILGETAQMIKLLGRQSVFVGFQAGVASTLVDLDVDLDRIETALTMEDGLDLLLRPDSSPVTGDDEDEEGGPERPEHDDSVENNLEDAS